MRAPKLPDDLSRGVDLESSAVIRFRNQRVSVREARGGSAPAGVKGLGGSSAVLSDLLPRLRLELQRTGCLPPGQTVVEQQKPAVGENPRIVLFREYIAEHPNHLLRVPVDHSKRRDISH